MPKRIIEIRDGYPRRELLQIGNARSHRLHPFGLKLSLIWSKIIAHLGQRCTDQHRCMIACKPLAELECASRYLSVIDHDIVSSTSLASDSQILKRIRYNAEILILVILILWTSECEAPVTHILIDGTASGRSSSQHDIVSAEILNTAFSPRILVATYHNASVILPQIEKILLDCGSGKQISFQCKIKPKLGLIGPCKKTLLHYLIPFVAKTDRHITS